MRGQQSQLNLVCPHTLALSLMEKELLRRVCGELELLRTNFDHKPANRLYDCSLSMASCSVLTNSSSAMSGNCFFREE